MRIALASDLHLNFADLPEAFFSNIDDADILVLAGDIVESCKIHRFEHVFQRLTQEYNKVFMVSGNHEFYNNGYQRSRREMQEMAAKFSNLWFMDDSAQILSDDIVLVGGTLWTDYNKGDPQTKHIATNYLNDFKCIRVESKGYRKMNPNDCYSWHTRTKQYICSVAREHRDKKVIVVTHHAPSYQSIHPNYRDQKHESGCFASDLSKLILDEESIVLWMHGHTHCPLSYVIGQCRVECNPRGYPGELGKEFFENYRPRVVEV